ncbi:hypothetical protein [Pseudarthrobacter sp. YAF2]|uniref:hypothetical protein n=1 Tax=Pseudarthrobacter sp. YAF2 TaxID=3233078 RepID=UPI003F97B298
MTFAGMSLVLVIPALLGAGSELLLHVAALIVGMQAAQSSVVQVGRNLASSYLGRTWVLASTAVFFTVCELLTELGSVVDAVFATISGALLGLVMGQSSLLILTGKGGTDFQLFQALRSIGLVIAATLAALSERLFTSASPLVMTIAVTVMIYYRPRVGRRRLGYGEPGLLSKGAAASIALGLVASLYYRNDVNWVRTAVSSTADFLLWHYALVIYGAVQGLVGFVLIQVVFSDRRKWRSRTHFLVERFAVLTICCWAVVVVASLVVLPALPVVPSVLGCSLLAAFVGSISGFAHVLDLSWAPYIAGVIGASALSGLLISGADPRLAMVVESTAIGSITIFLIFTQRRRACNSFN